MFKKLLCIGLLATSLSAGANQNVFEGGYVGVDLTFSKTSLSTLSSSGSEAGYGLSLGNGMFFNEVYLGFEVGYKGNYGKSKNATVNTNAKSGWDISFLPGVLIDKLTLLYARIGTGGVDIDITNATQTVTTGFDTTIWGVGVRHSFSDKVLGKIEINKTAMSKDGTEATTNSVFVGAQYKF